MIVYHTFEGIMCTGGMVFQTCHTVETQQCSDIAENSEQITSLTGCKEGCFCPPGMYIENGK